MDDRRTHGQLLMEITAISGEYPANNLRRLIPSSSYAKKVVTALIGDKLVKVVYKNGVRGYRLEIKGKRKLLADNPLRFADYLAGATDTNKQRNDHARRLRLHTTAEALTVLYNAGVRIFKDTKPPIYPLGTKIPPSQPALSQSALTITIPCFYSSREQKGEDDNAIRGSRAVGTLLTPTHAYAIYNTGTVESRWRESVEMRYRVAIHDSICRNLLFAQYKGEPVGGIMIGEEMTVLHKYLSAHAKTQATHAFLTETYQPFYFITNDKNGEAQLRLLCDNTRMVTLRKSMLKTYLPSDSKHPVEHDALTEDGNPVLFCCLLNIPRLVKFKTGVMLQGKVGTAIIFDFQKEVLGEYLGNGVVLKSISLEKVVERLYSH